MWSDMKESTPPYSKTPAFCESPLSDSDENVQERYDQVEQLGDPYLDNYTLERMRSRASVQSQGYRRAELEHHFQDDIFKLAADDVRRPQNWSIRKRLAHTLAFGLTTFSAQFGSSVMTPTVDQISEQFSVGREVGVLVFCIYLLGNVVGPVFFAPLSELYGRKVGVLFPSFVGGVCLCICANLDNIASLVVFRFIAGVFAAAPISVGGGAMADMWPPTIRAKALVLYAVSIMLGANSAPVLSALLVDTGSYGWRWASWLSGLISITISLVNLIFLSETFVPVIEQRITRHTRLDTGYWGLHCEQDMWHLSFKEIISVHLMRPLMMLATPIVLSLVTYAGFVFGLLFLITSTLSEQYINAWGFAFAPSYLPLFGYFIGYLVGCAVNVWNSDRYASLTKKQGHKLPPEERLVGMLMTSWLLPAGLFLYGWTLYTQVHWVVSCVGLGFVGLGLAVIFQGTLVFMTDVYEGYSASAIAAQTMMRCVFSGICPLFGKALYDTLNPHWASSLLGFIGIAMTPLPWLFYLYGEKIRAMDPFKKRVDTVAKTEKN